MAIIDILQHYDAKKKAAHAAKTVKHGVIERQRSQSSARFPPLTRCRVRGLPATNSSPLSPLPRPEQRSPR